MSESVLSRVHTLLKKLQWNKDQKCPVCKERETARQYDANGTYTNLNGSHDCDCELFQLMELIKARIRS